MRLGVLHVDVVNSNVDFDAEILVWPGCFVRVRCGPARDDLETDISSCSTTSGVSSNYSGEESPEDYPLLADTDVEERDTYAAHDVFF